ncbi:flavin reductase family protein [Roseicyclus sp. F158]|uniref:Flavin reductase family protein n=1 Tax=Tropicimonas omnivorans TaxID=3075590 RepID=A0ABU3DEN0_9RHOB|nr:flavin reductase family protein [Roseicyclus sp. F158]MDT0682177.1 flavin reductase family protein [Roseicyclus sp. F158]
MTHTLTDDAVDPRALRDCCGRFASGVTVVTTRTDEGDHGMTISAFMSVSLDPPLIAISVGRTSRMLGRLRTSGRFAVNVLAQHMRPHALHFAGKPDASLASLIEDRSGVPVLQSAAAILIADVAQEVEAGDHTLFIGHVRHLDHDPEAAPLLHHAGQFRRLEAIAAE